MLTATQIGLYTSPFRIFFSPATLLAGLFQLVMFGWFVMINTLLAVYLETPVDEGGYGMTPQQNAACASDTSLTIDTIC